MTNKERQRSLDKKKYIRSFNDNKDYTGEMFYCEACEFKSGIVCTTSQAQREAGSLCAKAYNRLQRK